MLHLKPACFSIFYDHMCWVYKISVYPMAQRLQSIIADIANDCKITYTVDSISCNYKVFFSDEDLFSLKNILSYFFKNILEAF